jgi:cysteine synthase
MATGSGAAVLVEKLSVQDGPKPRLKICGGVEEMIGGTPMVEVTSILKADGAVARVVAKMECLQPGGSVKDRIVLP